MQNDSRRASSGPSVGWRYYTVSRCCSKKGEDDFLFSGCIDNGGDLNCAEDSRENASGWKRRINQPPSSSSARAYVIETFAISITGTIEL